MRGGKAQDNTEGWATGYWKKLWGQLLLMQHSSGRAGLAGWLVTVETLFFFCFSSEVCTTPPVFEFTHTPGSSLGKFLLCSEEEGKWGLPGSSSHNADEALYPSKSSSTYMMNISSSNQWSPSKTPWSNLKCVCVQIQVSSKLSSKPPQTAWRLQPSALPSCTETNSKSHGFGRRKIARAPLAAINK